VKPREDPHVHGYAISGPPYPPRVSLLVPPDAQILGVGHQPPNLIIWVMEGDDPRTATKQVRIYRDDERFDLPRDQLGYLGTAVVPTPVESASPADAEGGEMIVLPYHIFEISPPEPQERPRRPYAFSEVRRRRGSGC
jgi:hypothetical protein